MYQPQLSHNRQQNSNSLSVDRESLDTPQQASSAINQLHSLNHPDVTAPLPSYDTPLRQSFDNNSIPTNNTEFLKSSVSSVSSADYALNVIFTQFKQLADAKMSFILNMGVVSTQGVQFFETYEF